MHSRLNALQYSTRHEDKFEQKKLELFSKFVSRENGGNNQRSIEMPSDLDIWVDSVGKKKARFFGLGSANKTMVTSVKVPVNSEDVNTLRSQIHTLNKSLQKQEQEKKGNETRIGLD
ncbi:hypothetical protein MtrunA17_Chr8g0345511 [Medicago truncatula]|uniref:Uncharacterized protein n=1 Tax=Medicago truncatula TaxID=3880 RepID=A0A396GJ31_MEDTR|nr:hypothetical protein MtrunA17_Chr8g0345511 [Medicago truncatula]